MLSAFASKWWLFLVQGVVMIALAILAYTQPGTIIIFIGAYAVIDGVLKLISGFGEQPDQQRRWPALLAGAVSVVAGLIIWFNPLFAATIITYVIAAWAIAVGVLIALWGIRLRQEISDEWTLLLFALLSIIFGVLVFANVQDGLLALRPIFAAFMVLGGVLALVLAFRVRSIGERLAAAR